VENVRPMRCTGPRLRADGDCGSHSLNSGPIIQHLDILMCIEIIDHLEKVLNNYIYAVSADVQVIRHPGTIWHDGDPQLF
jgi:hypothetical protein